MAARLLQWIALVLMGILLVPSGAHILTLPNKIGLPVEPYFVVQGIYRGWAWFGVVLFAALAANLAVTILLWNAGAARWLALVAFLAVIASLAIFFVWVFPGNQATANWTVVPDNWAELRDRWEYGHAASAIVILAGFAALAGAVLIAGAARGG